MAVTNWRDAVLTILSGATASEEVDLAAKGARRAKSLMIRGPATLAVTITVHVAEVVGGTYYPLSIGGSDFTIPAAKWVVLPLDMPIGALKLIAGSAVGEDEVFRIMGVAVR